MKARLRIAVALCAALVAGGGPALAQETDAPAANTVVGPPQLRDFNLNGTVTRPAEPTETPPQQPQPRPQPQQQVRQPPSQAPQPQARDTAPAPRIEQPPPVAQPVADPLATTETLPSSGAFPDLPLAPVTPESTTDTESTDSIGAVSESGGGLPTWTWLLAAVALVGAGAWFFLRQRPREGYAGVGEFDDLVARPAAEPAPPPVRPAPPPPPPPAKPKGVVSTGLRPWIELQFEPERAIVDGGKAAVEFRVSIVNSGSLPARDVFVGACLLNAGAHQDQQLKAFFGRPAGEAESVPVIGPLQTITVSNVVVLPRDQFQPIEIEGRSLIVPLVAFNCLYSWSNGSGQTSTSYLVGKQTEGEKLAPFRLDLGPRVFRNLAARENEVRIRK